eukprot:CAMPEP_0181103968 /NCGR_PEP_ID=MMETSP1071-20121207/15166_1 /TAXON_ID=35127 /ORGANISM="Thalassiosira sp., Strain NH16" /LENGTH=413 /DNA_ID=CAMNT_0023187113 /DNA_START=98 /DNA_END=1339 /DNA_ORIENTATION=-
MPYQLSTGSTNQRIRSNMKHNGDDKHPSSAAPRSNIKSKSRSQAQAQWKEHLRKGCLERAKLARRDRLRTSRLHSEDNDHEPRLVGNSSDASSVASQMIFGNGNIVSSKRGRDESHAEWNPSHISDEANVDHTPWCNPALQTSNNSCAEHERELDHDGQHGESGDIEANVDVMARSLVEQELQRALTGVQHCHQVCPLDGEIPCKRTNAGVAARDLDIMDSESNELRGGDESRQIKDEYIISQQEFAELLNDVTEELQREDELLEEEIWELERAEAMERERLMHQIDDFESWEELEQQQRNSQPNTYISPLAALDTPLITCPICNSSSLMETPHGGIKCVNADAAMPGNCTFQLDVTHEGLTLNHLESLLRSSYEMHSQICPTGVLRFRVEKRVGASFLMAKCEVCSSDVVVL